MHCLPLTNPVFGRSGDSTINQLISLVNDIHKSFDNRKSFEFRSAFLDISKAFDKVWHDGLIFKLELEFVSLGVIYSML